jgi:hypothetical protein
MVAVYYHTGVDCTRSATDGSEWYRYDSTDSTGSTQITIYPKGKLYRNATINIPAPPLTPVEKVDLADNPQYWAKPQQFVTKAREYINERIFRPQSKAQQREGQGCKNFIKQR